MINLDKTEKIIILCIFLAPIIVPVGVFLDTSDLCLALIWLIITLYPSMIVGFWLIYSSKSREINRILINALSQLKGDMNEKNEAKREIINDINRILHNKEESNGHEDNVK